MRGYFKDPKGRRLHLVFGVAPMALILVGLWGFVNNVNIPRLADKAPWETWGQAVICLAALFLLPAPFLFGDTWRDLGMAGGANLRWFRREATRRQRLWVLSAFAVAHLLIVAGYFGGGEPVLQWGFGKLIRQLGLKNAPHALLWFPIVSLNATFWLIFRFDNLREALPKFGAAAAVGAVFLLLLTWIADTWFSPGERLWDRWNTNEYLRGLLGRYILWGTIQQLLFLSFLNTRFRKGISDPRLSALATGLCFGLIHAPVWSLAFLTFLGGTAWAWCFQRAPHLFLAGFVHGALGTLLGVFLADPWVPMRVGPLSL